MVGFGVKSFESMVAYGFGQFQVKWTAVPADL